MHPSQNTMAFAFSPSESSHIAHVESSDGRAISDFRMFFVCMRETGFAKRGRDDCNMNTHQVEPFLLQPIHDDLERLVRHFVELPLFALAIDGVYPFLVYKRKRVAGWRLSAHTLAERRRTLLVHIILHLNR